MSLSPFSTCYLQGAVLNKKKMGLLLKPKPKQHLDLVPSSTIYLVKTRGFAVKICVHFLTSATY